MTTAPTDIAPPTPDQRLEALARPDKWYLSPGDGILWAPAFPAWLDAPGFWDEAHVYYHPFAPLFSVALVSPDGRDVPLALQDRKWRPDRLVSRFALPSGAVLTETKHALPGGRFRSSWTCEGPPGTELNECALVAYTAQPSEQLRDASPSCDGAHWTRVLKDRREIEMPVQASLRALNGQASVAGLRSEGSAPQPVWRFTPFVEKWEGGLRPEFRIEGVNDRGLAYFAVASKPGTLAKGAFEFEIELRVPDEYRVEPQPGTDVDADPWHDRFNRAPSFACSDAHVERYFDYRLYGLWLCRLAGGAGNVRHACIAEGISYFHVPITYSAQCHMFEMRWAPDADAARGSVLNFLEHQRDDGSIHGRIYTNHLVGTDFYHANWGDGTLAVDAIMPDSAFLERAYPGLSRYAGWLDAARDADSSGMIDVINHFETGQEYMSRYQAVNPRADEEGWKDSTRLKAIDATVYSYQLRRALAEIAARLGNDDEAARWRNSAASVGRAVTQRMWNADAGMFSDIDPATGKRTDVKAAVCFYPMLTDLLEEAHIERLLTHLTSPDEFWTTWPAPSSSVDDPMFNAEAEWKGKRHVCPWNGRVWPMTNSHVIEGLIRQYRLRAPDSAGARARCGPLASEMLTKFIHLMFHDRDLGRPNCFEHYNPYTGHACEYRGIDDYQHSWVDDLIVRGFAGLEPVGARGWAFGMSRDDERPGVLFDPLPGGPETLRLLNVGVRGRRCDVMIEGGRACLTVDGQSHETTIGTPMFLPFES